MQDLVAQIAKAPQLRSGAALFEDILSIQALLHNISARQLNILIQIFPKVFLKGPGPRFTDMLAKYEIQFSDILDAFTFATAILAETHKLLDQLSQQHFQQLLQEKEQAALAIARVSTP